MFLCIEDLRIVEKEVNAIQGTVVHFPRLQFHGS